MAILSKGCKPDDIESHSSLKLSFMNILGLCLNFVDCESFLELTLLTFLLYVRQTWMTHWCQYFVIKGLSSFKPKRFYYYSYAWSCSLCEVRAFFCTRLPQENSTSSCLCFSLALFYSEFYFSFFRLDMAVVGHENMVDEYGPANVTKICAEWLRN